MSPLSVKRSPRKFDKYHPLFFQFIFFYNLFRARVHLTLSRISNLSIYIFFLSNIQNILVIRKIIMVTIFFFVTTKFYLYTKIRFSISKHAYKRVPCISKEGDLRTSLYTLRGHITKVVQL